MSKIRISTKTGDSGTSALANGKRFPKNASFFTVVGDLDELNSWLGLIAAGLPEQFAVIRPKLYVLQETLFYIGAEVAQSPKAKLEPAKVTELEAWQTELEKKLEHNWHTKFLLPGGTVLGGQLDVARTVCRRAERSLVAHSHEQQISPVLAQYLNRLSDVLYLLRCFVNQQLSYDEKEFTARQKPQR